MATFRIGQRVKIVDGPLAIWRRHWVGCEVEILGLPGSIPRYPKCYEISRPSTESECYRHYGALPEYLAPLTDPRADEFLERLKRLGNEPVPMVKVKVEG